MSAFLLVLFQLLSYRKSDVEFGAKLRKLKEPIAIPIVVMVLTEGIVHNNKSGIFIFRRDKNCNFEP